MTNLQNRYDDLIHLLKNSNYSDQEIDLIKKSYTFASKWHENQKRKSGEPFIIHPLETAIKLVEWKMDLDTIVSGMLHDIIEDTEVSEEEIVTEFGSIVLSLVQLVTKISLIAKKNRESSQLKNLNANYQTQVFLSLAKDTRAIIIKLADRFHNLSTIQFLNPERQKAIAQETFDIYANIAGRLGMYNVKTQLLDIAFSIINNEAYNQTVSIINEYKLINEKQWKYISNKIQNLLDDENISYILESRIKSVYSTFNKLNSISRINNIHDVFALRIILDNELDIYHVLGLIHLNFKYISKFFKDYVSAPKNNLYQSVHTTIIDNNTLVEIQIRTKRMDENSKLGLASHWSYKEGSQTDITKEAMQRFQIDIFANSNNKDPSLIKELTKIPIIDVIVTNNQKIYSIPASANVLDLAYLVNPEKFGFILGIFRFGEKIPWDTKLENGDTIEITYSNSPTINDKWSQYISNPTIRKNIGQIIKKLEPIEYTSIQSFISKMNNVLKDKKTSDIEIMERLKVLNIKSIKEYLSLISFLHLSEKDQFIFFTKGNKWKSIIKEIRRKNSRWVFSQSYFENIDGLKINKIEIPRCCTKIPYLSVIGVANKGKLYVHNPLCKTIKLISNTKWIPLNWNKKNLEIKPRKFRANVEINGPWSESVVNNIVLNILKNQGSLQEIIINRDKQTEQFCANVVLYIIDSNQLNHIMNELKIRNLNFTWKII